MRCRSEAANTSAKSSRVSAVSRTHSPISASVVGSSFIFVDSDVDEYVRDLDEFLRLLAPGGMLVTSNLFLGQHLPSGHPWLAAGAQYRRRILDDRRLRTAFLPDGKAISVRIRER